MCVCVCVCVCVCGCLAHTSRLSCLCLSLRPSCVWGGGGAESDVICVPEQGEARFYCSIGTKSKSFLTFPAAHDVLAPVLEQAGQDFKLTDFKVSQFALMH